VFGEPVGDLGILKRGGVHFLAGRAPRGEEVNEHQLVLGGGPFDRLVESQVVELDPLRHGLLGQERGQ